ncbi:hypothetical protein [Marinobacter sp. VGCF2001]|uniref:hypothetical protein n=1 Tax=Marinobacter sp. VGCF2001 TaxID=3417189 RepID=UPI003CFAA698
MTFSLISRKLCAIVISAGMAGGALAASNSDEVRAALVGNTFKGSMGSEVYSSYFADDGTYDDAFGGGKYRITDEGVCYPDTDYGCYTAEIDGNTLEWFQNGESVGTGVIEQGDTLR